MGKHALGVLAWTLLGYLYLPVIVLLVFAFQGSGLLSLPFTGPSLRWFQFVVAEESFRSALMSSLKVGLAASVMAMVVGTLTGLAFTRYKLRFQRPLEAMSMAPIALPGLFIGLALLAYFGRLGMSLSLVTVFLAHLLYVLPYVLIVMRNRMERFDVAIEEAARDLGANAWQTFWKVIVPFMMPGLVAGALLAFTLSLDDFVITFFTSGPETVTFPVKVYSLVRRGVSPEINAASTVLIVITVVATVLAMKLQAPQKSGKG